MFNLHTISTGSKGNCYLLATLAWYVLLDAGVPINQIRKFLFEQGLSLSDIWFCFLSHAHADHSKAVKKLLEHGVALVTSPGTYSSLNLSKGYWDLNLMKPFEKKTDIEKEISIKTFPLIHDDIEPIGLVIDRREDRFVYITDTVYIPYRFKGVTHLAVECNYVDEILLQSNLNGTVRQRILKTHLGLRGLLLWLKRNKPYMPNLQKVWIVHLSDTHSDEEMIYREVKACLDGKVEVTIC